jgi:hypothetical protein
VSNRYLRVASFGAPLLALTLAASPVTAETIVSSSGKVGPYEINDQSGGPYGANCLYETSNPGELDKINIRPPANVHSYGASSSSQWVGWRYIIGRDAPPIDGHWVTYHQSSIVKERVNNNTDPSSFGRRTWTAPENVTGQWRVRIVIYWYKRPGSSEVSGKTKIEYDWYKSKRGAQWHEDQDRCLPHY